MPIHVRKNDYGPISSFMAKYLPDFPASRIAELEDDMILAVVLQTEPVPGSTADARGEAISLMQAAIDILEPGQSINWDRLKDVSGLPKHNRSDNSFIWHWAKDNHLLEHNPSRGAHFVKMIGPSTATH
jgi:hypothetical protein